MDVNGRVYVDTNQKARADKFSDPNKRTLIAENVAAKPPLKNGSPYPNSNMGKCSCRNRGLFNRLMTKV